MAVTLDIADLRARQTLRAGNGRPASAPMPVAAPAEVVNLAAAKEDGLGCHSGKATMRAAAEAAGMSDTLEQLRKDYPTGPHDQPQSMCPAFGSLRVGLRMRRTAT
ncbi:MAG: chlorophyllide reductase subunit Y, partial [Methylobacterium sp.]|nr:chlorophyllide reductase subunit Y [Methylobacterium sp.]